jgi:hypothetical protein
MTVNLTLIVQIIHFLIAYMILKRWLFKPAFEVMGEQDSRMQQAERELVAQRTHNEIVQQELIAEQQATKSFFNANKPLIAEETPEGVATPELMVPALPTDEQIAVQAQVVELLVKRAKE